MLCGIPLSAGDDEAAPSTRRTSLVGRALSGRRARRGCRAGSRDSRQLGRLGKVERPARAGTVGVYDLADGVGHGWSGRAEPVDCLGPLVVEPADAGRGCLGERDAGNLTCEDLIACVFGALQHAECVTSARQVGSPVGCVPRGDRERRGITGEVACAERLRRCGAPCRGGVVAVLPRQVDDLGAALGVEACEHADLGVLRQL